MADETKNVLASFENALIKGGTPPALRPTDEPSDPGQRTTEAEPETGRSPSEVVQPQSRPKPVDYTPETPDEQTFVVNGQTVTLKQLTTDYGKRGSIEKKYLETLEELKTLKTHPAATEPEQPKAIGNDDIARQYDPVAKAIIDDLMAKKLIGQEFVEMFPRELQTMVGQLRYSFEWLHNLQAKVAELDHVMGFAVRSREQEQKLGIINGKLDALVAQGDLFKPLANPQTREEFHQYVGKLNPETAPLLGEQGEEILADLFIGFMRAQIKAGKFTAANGKPKHEAKPHVKGEGAGARAGAGARVPEIDPDTPEGRERARQNALDQMAGLPPQ